MKMNINMKNTEPQLMHCVAYIDTVFLPGNNINVLNIIIMIERLVTVSGEGEPRWRNI